MLNILNALYVERPMQVRNLEGQFYVDIKWLGGLTFNIYLNMYEYLLIQIYTTFILNIQIF